MSDPLASLPDQIIAIANKPGGAADNDPHSWSLCLGCVLDLIDAAGVTIAPQPEAALREAAQKFVDVWGGTEAMESSHTFRALRAALSPDPAAPDPAAGTNLLDEDQGESAIDRRARERGEHW